MLSPPPDPAAADIVARLLALPPDARALAVEQLGPREREALDLDWPSWAHGGQLPPAAAPCGDDWRVWVIMAGRGFGKTRAGAEWVRASVLAAGDARPPLSIALVGATLDEARRVMVEGRSGLLEVADALVRDWSPKGPQLTTKTR